MSGLFRCLLITQTLVSLAFLGYTFEDKDHSLKSLDCPLVHGELHPKPTLFCNGKNRSTDQVWDTRDLFHMTAREALGIIEVIQNEKGNCDRGVIEGKKFIPLLNIRFQGESFRSIAEVAVRTANTMTDLLTHGACGGDLNNPKFDGDPTANMSDDFLFSIVHHNMQYHRLMYGSGIWFLKNKYKNRTYFSPYAYRKKEDGYLRVKDLSTTWGPAHTSFLPYMRDVARNRTFICKSSYFTPPKNETADGDAHHHTHAVAEYIDGMWGRPYFECGTTRAWIVGYFVPFFAVRYDKPDDDALEVM